MGDGQYDPDVQSSSEFPNSIPNVEELACSGPGAVSSDRPEWRLDSTEVPEGTASHRTAGVRARLFESALSYSGVAKTPRETVYSMQAFERLPIRYHAVVGGRAQDVSPSDEEVRAGVGSREAAHSFRCE